MQEEVEQKTVALVISAGKLTGRELKKAMLKLLAHLKDKKAHPQYPAGKTIGKTACRARSRYEQY
jgi:hypothetical protein